MFDALSPISRKILAVGLLIFVPALFMSLILLPLLGTMSDSLSRLERSRAERARLEAVLNRLPAKLGPPVDPRQLVVLDGPAPAITAIAGRITEAARLRTVTVNSLNETAGAPGGTIQAGLIANGTGAALAGFLNDLERGQPVLRFSSWSISREAAPGTEMRLDAVASAASSAAVP